MLVQLRAQRFCETQVGGHQGDRFAVAAALGRAQICIRFHTTHVVVHLEFFRIFLAHDEQRDEVPLAPPLTLHPIGQPLEFRRLRVAPPLFTELVTRL